MLGIKDSKAEMNQTVFLVEDDHSITEAIVDLFESAGIAVRCFSSAEEFLEGWSPELAGCLILDVRLPGISGMELQTKLVREHFALPAIIISAHGDVPMVRRAFKTGAVEFLSKPFLDEDLLEAVRQAFALDFERRSASDQIAEVHSRIGSLKRREYEVADLVTQGFTNREIAEKLRLSIVTIKLYRKLAMEKMQVESLADLVKIWGKQ